MRDTHGHGAGKSLPIGKGGACTGVGAIVGVAEGAGVGAAIGMPVGAALGVAVGDTMAPTDVQQARAQDLGDALQDRHAAAGRSVRESAWGVREARVSIYIQTGEEG